ncbi:polysaccharide biosynthesis protein [Candidatus Pelagibacter bacterium nBUS_29]|uniref:polysaccharide biosynthesis protein n=1 Tax=Candidatus Pelagibacter bacterium nBUS_29 TaxID=3374190 RepID=UPI003EC090B6
MLEKFQTFSKSILSLPRYAKQTIVLLVDSSLCIIAVWLSFYLRLDQFVPLKEQVLFVGLLSIFIALPIFWLSGLYRTIFRHSGKSSLISILFSLIVYGLIYFSIVTIYGIVNVPRSIGIIQPMLLFLTISGSRLFARFFLGGIYESKFKISSLPKVLIYGAGSAGRQVLAALENSNEMKVVGFVDDDKLLESQVLKGQNIYSPDDLASLIQVKNVSYILLAIPSVNRSKRMEIIKKIHNHKVIVRTLPTVTDLVEGNVTISDIRDLDIVDILGREMVAPDAELLSKNIYSKTVLVTGAGGSIGSELCRQIIKLNPKKLILIEISEYSLYKINVELEDIKLKNNLKKVKIISLIASVQDEVRINEILKTYMPNTMYHAAAYKHVPLVEENICEGLKNNIFGTLVAAKAAINNNVSDFVLISSDKAVRSTNIMGVSKRLAELCLQALFNNLKDQKIKLCMVRFGNVLDSSGSVIPKFKKQIRDGGPVTLTHPDVTRYFMTIPEAAELVIQAGAIAEGSDVFVLDMGKSIKIKDLIYKIIILSGLSVQDDDNPDGDIAIKIIGLRPGEKLFEELMLGDDPQPTKHSKIQRAKDPFIPWVELEQNLENLRLLIQKGKVEEIHQFLRNTVKSYNPNSDIVDHVFIEQKK